MAEYKALTNINLPFLNNGLGKMYAAGATIPSEEFEESVELATAALGPEADITSADDMIIAMMEAGSLSDDPDAELHPAHRPVAPGGPTVSSVVAESQALVADLESRGEEVPQEIRALAEIREVSTGDNVSGGE